MNDVQNNQLRMDLVEFFKKGDVDPVALQKQIAKVGKQIEVQETFVERGVTFGNGSSPAEYLASYKLLQSVLTDLVVNECKCECCGTSVAYEDDGLCDGCLERQHMEE